VGGAKASMHLFGYASDINLGTKELNKKLFEYIQKNLYYTEILNKYDYKCWYFIKIGDKYIFFFWWYC